MKKLRAKDIIFIAIIVIGMIFFIFQKFTNHDDPAADQVLQLAVGDATVFVTVADTDEKRYLGLGNNDRMDFDKGMLFIHGQPGRHAYSMRGMHFDLDFIFIREDRVVDIAKHVALEYPGTIQGATEYDRVLEVNAGWVRSNDIKIGDEVVEVK